MNRDLWNRDEPLRLRDVLTCRSLGQAIWWMVATIVALVSWDLFPVEAVNIAFAYVLATAALAIRAITRALVVAYPEWHRALNPEPPAEDNNRASDGDARREKAP